jgi:hypothetical protein
VIVEELDWLACGSAGYTSRCLGDLKTVEILLCDKNSDVESGNNEITARRHHANRLRVESLTKGLPLYGAWIVGALY